ncbi:MAG: hypothetical protein R6V14_08955 [Halanaerobiales bacterium]
MFKSYKKKVKNDRYDHKFNSDKYRDKVIYDLLKNNGFYFF